jgi:hypothetical protein
VARFYWISITQTSAMSYSISTLLIRNLRDVFGENAVSTPFTDHQ